MKIYIAHSSSFDFKNELYLPIRSSSLNEEHDIFLPHESDTFIDTKGTMSDFDLLIAEVSYPSTGEGIELGRAEAAGVPVVCLYKVGTTPSSALKTVTEIIIPYQDVAEMIEKIRELLSVR